MILLNYRRHIRPQSPADIASVRMERRRDAVEFEKKLVSADAMPCQHGSYRDNTRDGRVAQLFQHLAHSVEGFGLVIDRLLQAVEFVSQALDFRCFRHD